MDRHYRRWLDEPIPALRGSTPRQAAASRALRPVLIDLLRELENRSERAGQRGGAAYDPAWIRAELGIDEPRVAQDSNSPPPSSAGHLPVDGTVID